MLLEVDGVLCCTLKNYNSCLQESSVWLRRDAMDFLCELSPMLNIFILIDHKEKPEIVRKIIAKLVPFSVKGAIMFSKKMINDYRKVIQQLSVPDGTTVSVVRAVDTDIRTMGDFAQLVKEPNNQVARMTADLFPALMKTHIYFLRHNYFDIDPSRYHGEWSSEINLINIKGNEGLAQLSANLRKKSKKVHRVHEREAKHIEAAFHLERVLYNRANIINSLLGELRLVNKATGERRYPYPDTKEGIA